MKHPEIQAHIVAYAILLAFLAVLIFFLEKLQRPF